MIRHIVTWKLKETAEGKTRQENAAVMKALLEDLPSKIDELKSAEVGVNILPRSNEMVSDVVLITECETEEDLKAYAGHPDHQKVVQFIKKVTEERRVVDYEV